MPDTAREIENLVYAYAERIDAGDLAGVAELFRTDASRPRRRRRVRGRERVLKLYESSTRLYDDGTPRTRHVTTNVVVEVDDDAGTATARAYYTVFQQTDELPLQPIIAGRYHDTFHRVDGRWCVRHPRDVRRPHRRPQPPPALRPRLIAATSALESPPPLQDPSRRALEDPMKAAPLLLASALAALIGAGTQVADAGVITGVTAIAVGSNPFFPSSGGAGNVASFDPDAQTAVLEKDFDKLGDVPIIIDRTASQGVDTIHIDERVRNNTGLDWTDFHLVVELIDANEGLVVSFLNVANPTGEWTSGASNPGQLDLFGLVPAGGIFSLSFDLQMNDQVGAFALFGIHEVPTVPEPTTLGLVGIGLAGIAGLRKRDA